MPIIYDQNNRIFIKEEYQKHAGGLPCEANSPVDSFYTNHFIDSSQFDGSYFQFDTPLYRTFGGTLSYYGQDIYSVFTNVSRPFIHFVFSANTSSFGSGTTIKHNIYKIPYKTFSEYTSENIRKNIETLQNSITDIVETNSYDISGNVISTTATTITNRINNSQLLSPKKFPEEINNYNNANKLNNIINSLEQPILTITASTTGITNNVYDLFLDEYQKNKGSFKFQLFEDYSQYFITTQFQFERSQGTGYTEFYQFDSDKGLIQIDYQTGFTETTLNRYHTISAGTFVGINVTGNFFTYFLIPNKPNWENPLVKNQLTTFSPTFFWSHTDDADSFLLQVVYDYLDSTSFSGVVYSYPKSKEETNLSTNEILGGTSEDWSITQKSTDIIRKMSVPLLPNKTFWYRIGSVKELINIFGVKQKVITFSDIYSATTSSNKLSNYIVVESDSPYIEDMPTLMYPDYLDYNISSNFILSGTVHGSIITGATMQLIYPNNNYITQTTNIYGEYLFDNLDSGVYTLNTIYRGYQQDSRNINITGNTNSSFKLNLMWDNDIDTWGKMASENYYI